MSGFRLLLSKGEFFMAKIDWGEKLELKIRMLPESPGCYLMKDRSGEIIYVGKAKALKNRVVSYFRENSSHNEKTKKMVSCVNDFDFIVTGSEFEALVLECSLIKHYRPKYNILLMDDKGYHYRATVCIPDGMSCYYVDLTATSGGDVIYKLRQ